MNFGVIGLGTIGSLHADAIRTMDGGRLHSIFSRSPIPNDKIAALEGVLIHSDFEAFLADPNLEIVTIATPSGAHLEPTLAAMRAGKHVICEKPLEISTERIDRQIAAAAEHHVTLAAILNRRFHPAMDAMKSACDRQRFGQLTSASCYVKWYRDQAYYDSAGWRGTWNLDGGGALMNQGIHAIDALLYLAGPVVSVQAIVKCLAHERIEVEDIGMAMVEFENGAMGVIECSTCSWSEKGHPVRIQLSGTEGSAFLADENFEVWDFKSPSAADESIRKNWMNSSGKGLGANDPKAIQSVQHRRNFEEVSRAISEGRTPSTSAQEGRKSVALIEAIYCSASQGGTKVLI